MATVLSLLLLLVNSVEAHPFRPRPHVVVTHPRVTVVVSPSVRTYVPPPRVGWFWVGGYYDIRGEWVPGHWVAERPGWVWTPGFWYGDVWVEGHWRETP